LSSEPYDLMVAIHDVPFAIDNKMIGTAARSGK